MSAFEVKDVRNLGLVGHGGTGKTSLVEHILKETGMTDRAGTIDSGNTVGDYLEEEIARKFTISLKLTHTERQKTAIYIVDNPGYAAVVAEADDAPVRVQVDSRRVRAERKRQGRHANHVRQAGQGPHLPARRLRLLPLQPGSPGTGASHVHMSG